MNSYNEQLAAMVGQDKPCKDVSCADAQVRGDYASSPRPAREMKQPRGTVQSYTAVRER